MGFTMSIIFNAFISISGTVQEKIGRLRFSTSSIHFAVSLRPLKLCPSNLIHTCILQDHFTYTEVYYLFTPWGVLRIKQPEWLDHDERMPFHVQICSTFATLHPLYLLPFRLKCNERLRNCVRLKIVVHFSLRSFEM